MMHRSGFNLRHAELERDRIGQGRITRREFGALLVGGCVGELWMQYREAI